MDDIKESVQTDGTVEEPTQQVQSDKATATSADDVQKLVEALKPFIAEEVGKSTQSAKDKRFAKHEAKLDEFESKLAQYNELIKSGVSERDAIWRMKVEEKLFGTQVEGEDTGSSPSVVGSQAKATGGTENIDPSVFGLDPNDPDVVGLMRAGKGVSDFYALAEKKKSKKPAPGSVMTSGGGGSVPPEDDVESLTAKLVELRNNPRPYDKQYKDEMEKIRSKLAILQSR